MEVQAVLIFLFEGSDLVCEKVYFDHATIPPPTRRDRLMLQSRTPHALQEMGPGFEKS
jgi:hypothetical protein